MLNEKIVYRIGRILTIKLLSTKRTFERFSIVFHVFPIKMSLPLSPLKMEDAATDTFLFFIVDNQYLSATCKGKSR